jgi:hypothetical protein
MKPRGPQRTGWAVSAEGDTVYVQAVNKAKAVEAVEAIYGVPPGAIAMDVQPCKELPEGAAWEG